MCSAMNSWLSCEALLLPRNDADCFLMTDVIVSDKSSLCDTVGRIIQHEHINVRFVGMTRMERVGMGGGGEGRTYQAGRILLSADAAWDGRDRSCGHV